jgi:methylated-DNA-[protein]-cysteine S-methyltransferase
MKGFPKHATAARTISSQVGDLVLLASEEGLAGLFFAHRIGENEVPGDDAGNVHLNAAEEQLGEFFAGTRESFEVAFDVAGTEFQKSVWAELSRIPFGVTRSYRDIAERIGNPKGVRAVGLANRSNPISVIVPCHRVIGANGALTGFGGGLEIKRRLLVFEGALLDVA